MSPRLTRLDAHLPIVLTLCESRPNPYPTLTKAARYLLDYLQDRRVCYPSPMWFGSAVHLSMMANMPFERGGPALQALMACGLVTVEREGGAVGVDQRRQFHLLHLLKQQRNVIDPLRDDTGYLIHTQSLTQSAIYLQI